MASEPLQPVALGPDEAFLDASVHCQHMFEGTIRDAADLLRVSILESNQDLPRPRSDSILDQVARPRGTGSSYYRRWLSHRWWRHWLGRERNALCFFAGQLMLKSQPSLSLFLHTVLYIDSKDPLTLEHENRFLLGDLCSNCLFLACCDESLQPVQLGVQLR